MASFKDHLTHEHTNLSSNVHAKGIAQELFDILK